MLLFAGFKSRKRLKSSGDSKPMVLALIAFAKFLATLGLFLNALVISTTLPERVVILIFASPPFGVLNSPVAGSINAGNACSLII